METITVGIREAKAHLSRLLKRVQRGDEVLLKDRGRPVARIVPIDQDRLALSERVSLLEEQGVIDPVSATQRRNTPAPIPIPDSLAQGFLQQDRDNETC